MGTDISESATVQSRPAELTVASGRVDINTDADGVIHRTNSTGTTTEG